MSNQDQDLSKAINEAVRPRRRPRYALGTFWLLVGIVTLVYGFAGTMSGHQNGIWGGLILIGYAVYLYRGGRFGFFIF